MSACFSWPAGEYTARAEDRRQLHLDVVEERCMYAFHTSSGGRALVPASAAIGAARGRTRRAHIRKVFGVPKQNHVFSWVV